MKKKKKIEKDCLCREHWGGGRGGAGIWAGSQEDRGSFVSSGGTMCPSLGEEPETVFLMTKSIMLHSPRADAQQGNKNLERE